MNVPLTLNPVLNNVVEATNATFWAKLRQHDHTRYMRRLMIKSKGAARPYFFNLDAFSLRRGTKEAQLLKDKI